MTLADPDQLDESKNLYNIGAGEIMWRNFLAGISRALGGMVVYFFLAFLLGQLFVTFIWPAIEPSIETMGETGQMLEQLNSLQGSNSLR